MEKEKSERKRLCLFFSFLLQLQSICWISLRW